MIIAFTAIQSWGVQGVEVMGPTKWKRLVDAVSRRFRALMVVLRDPAGAKQKAEAAEAARWVTLDTHGICRQCA